VCGAHSRTLIVVLVPHDHTLAYFLPARRLLALTIRGLCQQLKKVRDGRKRLGACAANAMLRSNLT
jgi:hypothetical protein